MYTEAVKKVQLHLDQQFESPADLIGEFWDKVQNVLIQHYQCAYRQRSTTLVIVNYTPSMVVINYVDDNFILS